MRPALLTLALVLSCASSGTEPVPTPTPRTYRMGFSPLPPRLTVAEVLRTIDSVSRHADAALMVVDVPWKALLADTSAAQLIRRTRPQGGVGGLQLGVILHRAGVRLVDSREDEVVHQIVEIAPRAARVLDHLEQKGGRQPADQPALARSHLLRHALPPQV